MKFAIIWTENIEFPAIAGTATSINLMSYTIYAKVKDDHPIHSESRYLREEDS